MSKSRTVRLRLVANFTGAKSASASIHPSHKPLAMTRLPDNGLSDWRWTGKVSGKQRIMLGSSTVRWPTGSNGTPMNCQRPYRSQASPSKWPNRTNSSPSWARKNEVYVMTIVDRHKRCFLAIEAVAIRCQGVAQQMVNQALAEQYYSDQFSLSQSDLPSRVPLIAGG